MQIQKTGTVSVTEYEYSEITEVCCEIIIVSENLLFMGVVVEYPITEHIYNLGYIFLSKNILVSRQTNNKGVHHHFIWDYIEDGTVKIKNFYSEEILQINLPRT